MRWLAITLALLSCLAWRPSVVAGGAGAQTSAGGGGGGGGDGSYVVTSDSTTNDPNFNSSEPMCETSDGSTPIDSSVVLCDDFEDGDWAQNRNGPVLAADDGWFNVPFGEEGLALNLVWAECDSESPLGALNSPCRGNPGPFDGSDADFNQHPLSAKTHLSSEVTGTVHTRFYLHFPAGYTHTDGTLKLVTWNHAEGEDGAAGIDFSNMISQGMTPKFNIRGDDVLQEQNQGNSITFQTGRWYAIEVEMGISSVGENDGTLDMWIDDCGADGTGCTGAQTLRLSSTGHDHRNPGGRAAAGGGVDNLWIEFWQPCNIDTDPADGISDLCENLTGQEVYVDQIIVRDGQQIGWASYGLE